MWTGIRQLWNIISQMSAIISITLLQPQVPEMGILFIILHLILMVQGIDNLKFISFVMIFSSILFIRFTV